MTTFIVCMHCKTKVDTVSGSGWDAKGRYCRYCKTKEQREAMDKANKEINPKYYCKHCEGRKKESE